MLLSRDFHLFVSRREAEIELLEKQRKLEEFNIQELMTRSLDAEELLHEG